MGTLCNLNLVIFKCFYYQSEKIVAGDINSLNLLVLPVGAQYNSSFMKISVPSPVFRRKTL